MARVPNFEKAEVPEAKVLGYLLNDAHPRGRGKAWLFLRRGYTALDWQQLADALKRHLAVNDYSAKMDTEFGRKFEVIGTMAVPTGTEPLVKTIWMIKNGEEWPTFVTAYPVKGKL